MKIAQIIYTLTAGGAETFVKELSEELTEQGHSVTVLLLNKDHGDPIQKKAVHYLETVGIDIRNLNRYPGRLNLNPFFRLCRELRRERYDIIHSHLSLPDILARIASLLTNSRTKHVSTIHNTKHSKHWLLSKVWAFLQARTSIVFCSQAAALAWASETKNSVIIPNGVNEHDSIAGNRLSGFKQKLKKQLKLSCDTSLVINVGRLAEQKNQKLLIESIAVAKRENPLIACIICGSGGLQEKLEKRTHELKLQDTVFFLGNRSDIAKLLMVSDLFVSTSAWEGLPISALEAFFSGIPCLFSNINEHKEIANGICMATVVPENTQEIIAGGILDMLKLNVTRNEIKFARSPDLQKYSMKTCAQEYIAYYERVRGVRNEI